jgi:hypothetical protein
MANRSRKPPADPAEAAASILAQLTGEKPKVDPPVKNPAAVALGRRGGEKRAESLTATDKKRIAQAAARKRWGSSADQEK